MKFLVVLSAVCAMACGSLYGPADYLPAVLLDPHGRPLDTPAVVNARAIHLQAKALEGAHAPLALGYGHGLGYGGLGSLGLGYGSGLGYAGLGLGGAHVLGKRSLGHVGYAAPSSAVTHQSRVDVISSPPVVSHDIAAHAPIVAHAAPIVAHAAPIVAHAAPASAVSHQSRVDVISSPPVVSHVPIVAHTAPIVAHAAPVVAHAAPIVTHAAPASAVSHQSRVDVISSPAVVSHAVAGPIVAHAAPIVEHVQPIVAHAAPIVAHASPASAITHQSRVDVSTGYDSLGHSAASYGALPYGGLSHYLNKRSLGHYVHAAPAVSHQARVDVIASPVVSHAVAAPVYAHAAPVVAHAPAVSHQSRVDVRTSHASPYLSGYGASGGLYSSAPLINAW